MELKDLFRLIEKFETSTLSQFHYENADEKVTLKRDAAGGALPYYTQPVMVQPHAAVAGAAPNAAAAPATPQSADATGTTTSGTATETAGPGEGVEQITSPIVGTFYRSASPDSPPFVKEGDVVESGQTVCILEAMKVMNELEAEFNMEIISILVKNGDMVDFGTPLLEVRRV